MKLNSRLKINSDHIAFPRRRRGFTLIELLLVMGIIAVLAGLSLVVLRGAEQDALVARSTSQVQRINQLLAIKWDEYQTRVLRFRFEQVSGDANMTANEIERIRNRALMDLARVEFPNSIDDLEQFPSLHSQGEPPIDLDQVDPSVLNYWPNSYRDNYLSIVNVPYSQPSALIRMRGRLGMSYVMTKGNGVDVWGPGGWTAQNEQAECLYAILQGIRIDDINGLEYVRLRPDEVGDLDGDGRLEVLDAFGDPLTFTFDDPRTVAVENDINTQFPRMSLKTPFIAVSINMSGT